MKVLIKTAYYLFICCVLALGLLLLSTMVPIPGNWKAKIVKSGSMEPAIKTGSMVFIRPSPSYGVGDIVTFGKDTKTQIPTTHRIVEVTNEGISKLYTTKGDANDTVDPAQIKFSDIRGKVFLTLPYLGYIIDFAKKPIGFALLVGLPALLIIVEEAINIFKQIRGMRKRGKPGGTSSGSDILPPGTGSGNILNLRDRIELNEISRINYGIFSSQNMLTKVTAVLLVLIWPLSRGALIGNTVSYFNDVERSRGNVFQASGDFGLTIASIETDNTEEGFVLGTSTILFVGPSDARPMGEGDIVDETAVPEEPTTEEGIEEIIKPDVEPTPEEDEPEKEEVAESGPVEEPVVETSIEEGAQEQEEAQQEELEEQESDEVVIDETTEPTPPEPSTESIEAPSETPTEAPTE